MIAIVLTTEAHRGKQKSIYRRAVGWAELAKPDTIGEPLMPLLGFTLFSPTYDPPRPDR